ncbi:MAG: hypothetical protein LBS63_05955 [Prevotellaceae bacterium]|jgi:hypothetical protein|nr:hypothetical protein [Prevotellaceae bacterium]
MLHRLLKNKWHFFCLTLALSAFACDEEYVCPVPDVGHFLFDVRISSHEVMTGTLKAHFGYKEHGVMVYHYFDKEVYAFDATCPNDAECIAGGVVAFDGAGKATGTCQRCKAQYNLMDGKHASKKLRLRQYAANPMPNATDYYQVSN